MNVLALHMTLSVKFQSLGEIYLKTGSAVTKPSPTSPNPSITLHSSSAPWVPSDREATLKQASEYNAMMLGRGKCQEVYHQRKKIPRLGGGGEGCGGSGRWGR